MFVYINTSVSDIIELALWNADVYGSDVVQSKRQHEELLLNSITELCAKHSIVLKNIKGIAVVHGPGSFASLRIALAVANALGYANQVPVVGVDAVDISLVENRAQLAHKILASDSQSQAQAQYGREPNIR